MTNKKVSVEEMVEFLDWIRGWASLYGKSAEWGAIRAALLKLEEFGKRVDGFLWEGDLLLTNKMIVVDSSEIVAFLKELRDFGEKEEP